MNAPERFVYPEMGELNVANDLLGDDAALKAAWDRDGYWFFRNVLDQTAIGRARQRFLDYLADRGMIVRGDAEARHTGVVPEGWSDMVEDIARQKLAQQEIMADDKVNAFFARLFGCPPLWVPFTVYRCSVPNANRSRSRSRFDMIHEDGTYSNGLPFLICWIPLAEIDDEVGGLALAEGLHHGPCLHKMDGIRILPIEDEVIPAHAWKRTTYRPGDVLLMDQRTPHSGLANYSDRFRLSIDTRILPDRGDVPIIGTLTAFSLNGLTVRDHKGETTLSLDDESYCRGQYGNRILRPDLPQEYHPGSEVIVAHDGRRVICMRPQH